MSMIIHVHPDGEGDGSAESPCSVNRIPYLIHKARSTGASDVTDLSPRRGAPDLSTDPGESSGLDVALGRDPEFVHEGSSKAAFVAADRDREVPDARRFARMLIQVDARSRHDCPALSPVPGER